MYEITLIIPVYNVEKYLQNTLSSVVAQTIFHQMKIVLVDDGSNDNSRTICESFVSKYPNIELIIKENGGVSSARNVGLTKVDTPYVGFFDSDDIMYPKMYEVLLSNMKNQQADLATINFSNYFQEENIEKVKNKEVFMILDKQKMIQKAFLTSNLIENSVCDKLFKTALLENIRFEENIAIGEDMFFIFNYLLKAKTVVVDTREIGFKYIHNNKSAMNQSVFSDKYLEPVILSSQMVVMSDQAIVDCAKAHLIHEKCKSVYLMMKKNATDHPKYKEYLSDIREYPLLEAWRNLSKKLFISVLLMKISPRLYQMVRK